MEPYSLENLRDPVKFVELLAPELEQHLLSWQVAMLQAMVERGVALREPDPGPPRRRAAELFSRARAHPLALQLVPIPLPN